jgi:carboxyl-terminal processing protease
MRGRLLVLALVLVAAACSPSTTPETTTTAPETTTTTTVVSENGREVNAVPCTTPPAEVAFVCEVYLLIMDRYVDDIEGADLAAAATAGLEEAEVGNATETLVCAIPDESFIETCAAAADLNLTTTETAEVIINSLIKNALDPNTVYLNPEALARVIESEQGSVEGIGAQVIAEDQTIEGENKQCQVISATCQLSIVDTIEGTPARAAGVLARDVLLAVNGELVIGLTVDEVISMVRGPAGTAVNLTFDREGETVSFDIVRARVEVPVISKEIVGSTGYIRLFGFSDSADERFEEAILDHIAAGVEDLVIDFRGNPGGLLTSAIGVASVFLPDGDVVLTQGPEGDFNFSVTGATIVPLDMPVSVIVNRGSASASEVVVGVLQERDRVEAYGENTFGKNTVQQRFNLSNGGAIRLTTARWLTPGGLDFGSTGLTPDVAMEFDPSATPAEVVAALRSAGA